MQAALRAGKHLARLSTQARAPAHTRSMSSGASIEESIGEMNKWRNVTYLAVPGSVIFAAYTLLNEHPHHHDPDAPQYPYMHIRTKTFPWGECGLFENCDAHGEEEEE